MAINKKLIHFKNKEKFNEELAKGNILNTSIVFILDTTEIYTHELFYDGSTFDPSNIEASIAKLEEEVDEINFILVDAGGSAEDPAIPVYPEDLENYVTEEELAAKNYVTTETLNLAVQAVNFNINGVNQSINSTLQNVSEKANKADATATDALNLVEGIQGNLSSFALKTDLKDYITTTDAHEYTDTAIANLVDSAPETLNTLNELATAISDHLDVTDALEAAISNKADKTEIPTKLSQLENDANFFPEANIKATSVSEEIDEPNIKYLTTSPLALTEVEQITVKDNLGINLSEYATKEELSNTSEITPIINHDANDSVYELTPNVYHKWGEMTSLELTLAEPSNANIYNEYMFEFISGETATTLSLPSTIKWVSTPSIESNKIYQCSIVNNVGIIAAASNS